MFPLSELSYWYTEPTPLRILRNRECGMVVFGSPFLNDEPLIAVHRSLTAFVTRTLTSLPSLG